MPKVNFTQSFVDRVKPDPDKEVVLYTDLTTPALGLCVYKSGRKSYCFRYPKSSKRYNFDDAKNIPVFQAREIAQHHSSQYAMGIDPANGIKKPTLYEVAIEYRELRKQNSPTERKASKSSLRDWRLMIKNFLLDTVAGKCHIDNLTVMHCRQLMDGAAHTPAWANRTRSYLRKVYKYAQQKGYVNTKHNIWDAVDTFIEKKEQARFTNDMEVEAFKQYMVDCYTGKKTLLTGKPVNIIWTIFILVSYLTGARPNELRTALRDNYLRDKKRIIITSHKTYHHTNKEKIIYLTDDAAFLLDKLPFVRNNPYLFPSLRKQGKPMNNYKRQWNIMREEIGLKEATPYSLRRWFSSVGLDEHDGDSTIMKQITQHKDEKMVKYYAGRVERLEEKKHNVVSLHNEKVGRRLAKGLKLNSHVKDT